MSRGEKVQLDAVLNHVLGVQLMHRHFIANDIPKVAEQRTNLLGWKSNRNK